MNHFHHKKAFTLIELLVVIAIIAILAAILFPVFAQAKLAAKKSVDLSNYKQINLATTMYSNDYDGGYPFCWGISSTWTPWHQAVSPYVKNTQLWKSPVDNWARPTVTNGDTCDGVNPGPSVTYSMNYMDPWMGNNDYPDNGTWWGSASSQCLMSPTCDDQSGTETAVPQTASTILISPRPNWYHEWCSGSATNQFYASGEYLDKPVQGSSMFGNGSNYGFCDGHVKFAPPGATTKAQGSQAGTPPPSWWPTGDTHYWPWPMGMWDKRQ